ETNPHAGRSTVRTSGSTLEREPTARTGFNPGSSASIQTPDRLGSRESPEKEKDHGTRTEVRSHHHRLGAAVGRVHGQRAGLPAPGGLPRAARRRSDG